MVENLEFVTISDIWEIPAGFLEAVCLPPGAPKVRLGTFLGGRFQQRCEKSSGGYRG